MSFNKKNNFWNKINREAKQLQLDHMLILFKITKSLENRRKFEETPSAPDYIFMICDMKEPKYSDVQPLEIEEPKIEKKKIKRCNLL